MVRWLPGFRRSVARPARAPRPRPRPAAAALAPAPGPARDGGYRIASRALTHDGCVRPHNEDSFLARDGDGLWAVADGMGGHEGGEWASGRIVAELARSVADGSLEERAAAAEAALRTANAAILAEGRARGKSMGSTAVLLLVEGRRYALIWVGDSRAYLLRGGRLVRLTRDHSQVQELVTRGLLAEAEADGHPMSHVLSRAIGVQAEAEAERETGEIQPGDIFLLSSDGLHGVAGDEAIAAHFSREAPEDALDSLLALTLARGAPDNVTGIAIWFSEPTLLSFPDARP